MPKRPSITSEYKFWVTLIGALFSAGPIISLIQKLSGIGLVPLLANALAYYRGITYPLVDWLRYIISFIPFLDLYRFVFSWFMSLETYRDLTVLSFVCVAAAFRAFKTVESMKSPGSRVQDHPHYISGSIILVIQLCLVAYTLIPLLFLIMHYAVAARTNSNDPEIVMYSRLSLLYLLVAFTAAGGYFVVNELMR